MLGLCKWGSVSKPYARRLRHSVMMLRAQITRLFGSRTRFGIMCAGTCRLLMCTTNRGTGSVIGPWFRTVMHCDRNGKSNSSWQAEGTCVAVVRAEHRCMTCARRWVLLSETDGVLLENPFGRSCLIDYVHRANTWTFSHARSNNQLISRKMV